METTDSADVMARRKANPSERSIETARKDAECAQWRAEGLTYPQIAAKRGCAVSSAYDAVQRAIAAVPVEAVTELRAVESDRLNNVIADLWHIARNDGFDASARISAYREIRVAGESLRKMFGVDAPTRQIVTVITEDVVDAEIKRLEEELAARDAADHASEPA